MALTEAEQTNKNYVLGKITVHALRDISLELYKGELIMILGSSGPGKSTLLNILDGIETAASGGLLYGGKGPGWKDKKALTAYRRTHAGFALQFYNLVPGLMALENVELAAESGECPLDVGGLMEQVGLTNRADHFPNEFSGGQQQRAAIARVLCKNPDILLYGEPTGVLDSRTGVQILKLLADFNRAYQKVVVLITRNQKIAQIAHWVFYSKNGCLERIGQSESLLRPEEVDWQ